MKKLVLVLLIGVVAGTAAFADHPSDKLGIGGIFGVGAGGLGIDLSPALSLKVPNIPIFWGLSASIGSANYFGLGVTGDFYIFEWNLVDKISTNDDGSYHVKIDWYLGLGFYANLDFWEEKDDEGKRETVTRGGLGLRIPFGVSWHALEQLEVAVGIAPRLGWYGHPDHYFNWTIPMELAVRYWVK